MLTIQEKNQIKLLLQSPQWQTAERVANLLCDKIKYEEVLKENQWETIKAVLVNEGQTRGIRRYIKELYDQATQSK